MTDPALFGDQYGGESWTAWRALLAGFYGLPLDDAEREHWEDLTGGRSAPESPADELWLAVGRRGGKSQCAALLAVYEAAFRDHRDKLAPGEVATVRVMAADRQQARVVMRYIGGLIESNPMLERMVVRQSPEAIELSNRTLLEVGTASYRTARGYSFAAVICDELAFWRSDDSANPDHEIIAAVRPGLATLGGKLIALSSPYARRGELWRTYERHYGQDGPVLVAQAPSRTLNPELPQRVVDEALERDPDAARAEYLAQFRSDVESFAQREVIQRATRPDPLELPPLARRYFAYADPAGGGRDEFTIAIGHIESSGTEGPLEPVNVATLYGEATHWRRPRGPSRVIVDVVEARRGRPAEIVREFAELLKRYGVRSITADRYAGSWPSDEFGLHGIRCDPAPKSKSELYLDLLPALNSGRVELPPDDRLLTQLQSLERRTSRAGRDTVDHPPGGHDDRANAVAGLVACAPKAQGRTVGAVPIEGMI
nr:MULTISPECIES: hypothetical protein [Halorhodospira]